jgi:hypothetical protein
VPVAGFVLLKYTFNSPDTASGFIVLMFTAQRDEVP